MSEKDVIKDTRPRMDTVIEDFRRKQLAKQVHETAEDHRTATRNIRRDANERLKKMLKDKQISEDNERDGLEEVQKLTNNYISKIDDLTKTKEHEITSV